jgi:hypothetical protein
VRLCLFYWASFCSALAFFTSLSWFDHALSVCEESLTCPRRGDWINVSFCVILTPTAALKCVVVMALDALLSPIIILLTMSAYGASGCCTERGERFTRLCLPKMLERIRHDHRKGRDSAV